MTVDVFAAREPAGPVIDFARYRGGVGWTCSACPEHPWLLRLRDIDAHLAAVHPNWGESRVETR